jgi:hypothetical protein
MRVGIFSPKRFVICTSMSHIDLDFKSQFVEIALGYLVLQASCKLVTIETWHKL